MGKPENPGDLELLWSEHFAPNASVSIDPKRWNFDLGDGSDHGIPGWGNNEREYYLESAVTVSDGLTITARRQANDSQLQTYYGPAEWTSGKIHTSGKVSFLFGYFEFKIKIPSGKGTWPAIWMLGDAISTVPWPDCGEIDIFEGSGNEPRTVRGTLHGPGYSADKGVTAAVDHTSDLCDSEHLLGLLWKPNSIEWFFDGKSYSTITADDGVLAGKTWPFNAPHYLIINLAMGGWFAGAIDPNLNQAEFKVSSIDFYRINGIGEVVQQI